MHTKNYRATFQMRIFFFKETYIELPSEIHHFVSRANGRALMGEEVAMKTENGLDEKDLVGHED